MIHDKKDIVGVGIGPSNLSLAALAYPIKQFSSIFFDKRKNFQWHKGMQIPASKLQVSYLKDLVTMVDPSNPLSFLSFLSCQKRLYQFVNANFHKVSRIEFFHYYQWACQFLKSTLMFNSEVKEISLFEGRLLVKTNNKNFLANSVVLGNGLSPSIPAFARMKINNTLFHSSTFMENKLNYKNKKIIIIGGGQSSAEIVLHLISDNSKLPKKITWITRRDNFLPLDDSPFVNELFTPPYSNYFYNMPISKRKELIAKQKLFSDGISNSTLEDIYKRFYEIYYLNGKENICDLVTNSEVINAHKKQKSWCIETKNFCKNITMHCDSDIVILCTGYQYELPSFLHKLSDEFQRDDDGNLIINEDYSLKWKNSTDHRIYIQNGAKHSRGIADPNLSLTPWRSALILNSIAKQRIYDVDNYKSFFDWKN